MKSIPGGRVVVIGPTEQARTLVRALGDTARIAEIQVFATDLPAASPGPTPGDIRRYGGDTAVYEFARDGRPLAAVVDLRSAEGLQRSTFGSLALTLATGGAYLVTDDARLRPHWLLRLPELSESDAHLKQFDGGMDIEQLGGFVSAVKTVRHILTLDEPRADRLLAMRCPDLEVELLDRLPATHLESKSRFTHHPAVPRSNYDTNLYIPELSLRRYSGRLDCLRHLLTLNSDTALPSSFRFPFATYPPNARLDDVNRDYGIMHQDAIKQLDQIRYLVGSYFDASSAWPHHFGHWMTEVPAKLWGWERAKRAVPDLKALVTLAPGQEATFERQVLNAYGIPDSDIVTTTQPVWVKTLVTANAAWHNQRPYFGHPMMLDTWQRIGDRLAEPLPDAPSKVFISRPDGLDRGLHQTKELEEYFAAAGFAVVYPERLPLGQQVTLFRSAKVVAGLTGSAMFNLMFGSGDTRVIAFVSNTYTARHEHLITSLLGNRIDYFWGTSDVQHNSGGWTKDAFFSQWSIDLEAIKPELDTILAESAG